MRTELIRRILGFLLAVTGVAVGVAAIWAWRTTDELDYLLFGIVALPLFGWGWARMFPGEPAPLDLPLDEPLLVEAGNQARDRLDEFLEGLDDLNLEPYAKVSMDTQFGGREALWAIVHSGNADEFVVSLVSEPVEPLSTPAVRYRVPSVEINDWMLIDENGQIRGAFTEFALAKLYQREKGYVPDAVKRRLRDIVNDDVGSPL